MTETHDIQVRLGAERITALKSIETISRDLGELIASVEHANHDDEHDPEGSTIAFERAQLNALLDDARASLAAIDHALTRWFDGNYGQCERCSKPITAERLSALPGTVMCFECASSSSTQH
jgi:DnaK suppressor protein